MTVTLSGAGSGTTSTDGSGNYSFGGLPAGDFTVTMINPDPINYSFASPTANVTLAPAGSAVVNFSGTPNE